jgi:hypothetical protein
MGGCAGVNGVLRGHAAHSNERLNPLRFFAARIARDGERALRACGGTRLATGEATFMLLRPGLGRRESTRMYESFDT